MHIPPTLQKLLLGTTLALALSGCALPTTAPTLPTPPPPAPAPAPIDIDIHLPPPALQQHTPTNDRPPTTPPPGQQAPTTATTAPGNAGSSPPPIASPSPTPQPAYTPHPIPSAPPDTTTAPAPPCTPRTPGTTNPSGSPYKPTTTTSPHPPTSRPETQRVAVVQAGRVAVTPTGKEIGRLDLTHPRLDGLAFLQGAARGPGEPVHQPTPLPEPSDGDRLGSVKRMALSYEVCRSFR